MQTILYKRKFWRDRLTQILGVSVVLFCIVMDVSPQDFIYLLYPMFIFVLRWSLCNYVKIENNELYLINYILRWHKRSFNINQIEHVGFERTKNTSASVLMQVLTAKKWSKQFTIQVKDKKQLRELMEDLRSRNIHINYKDYIK